MMYMNTWYSCWTKNLCLSDTIFLDFLFQTFRLLFQILDIGSKSEIIQPTYTGTISIHEFLDTLIGSTYILLSVILVLIGRQLWVSMAVSLRKWFAVEMTTAFQHNYEGML
jgi:hypothetical protein